MSKKLSILKIATGYHALSRTVSGVRDSLDRLSGLVSRRKDAPDAPDVPSTIGSGKYSVRSLDGRQVYRSDDFSTALRRAYSDDEIVEMISGADLASKLLYVGAAFLVLGAVGVALAGSPVALISLLCLPLPLAYAVTYGTMAATLRSQSLVTPAAYCRRLWRGA